MIIKSVAELKSFVARERNNGRSIGLVPTMGALHAGHLSLVERAVRENETVIASVFVNPTQFNNPTDLANYPRTEEEDCRLLARAGVTVAFVPDVSEMYPRGAVREKEFDLGPAAEVMEGRYRPGHFQGVAQIVSRLFEICRPNRAYFGEKDFQQIAVIRNMVASEHIDVDIVSCPIKRADDGLALSSRNSLLTPQGRKVAPEIYAALKFGVEYSMQHDVAATKEAVVKRIDSFDGLRTEYFEIVDARTLQAVDSWKESPWIVGCITVYDGDIRLIDNIRFR